MKFNISYPLSGAQKCIEIDDDKKCSIFYDRRMGQQIEVDILGDEFKGYVFKITGGNDKQGFPMRQGVLIKGRTRILLRKGAKGYRPRRSGEMKRKSVRGCIVGQDIRVLALQIVKKGNAEIDGLTNVNVPRRIGPKRVTRLRRLFGFKKEDGISLIKKTMIRRTFQAKDGHKRQKAAKIQRLVTDARLRRKTLVKKVNETRWAKNKADLESYKKLAHDVHEAKRKHRKASSEIVEKKPVEVKKVDPKKAAVQTKTGKQAPVTVTKTTTQQKPAPAQKAVPQQKPATTKPVKPVSKK